jgi:flavin reductase (DIM6/NTAB) family NADH-FMN oxidoreductase RutF
MNHDTGDLVGTPQAESKDVADKLIPVSDELALRAAFGCFPSGVIAICALDVEGRPVGMAASAFVPLSLDPPLVAISIQRTSTSWPRLRQIERLGLSVMAQDHEDVCARLSGKGDRFGAVEWMPTSTGAVLIRGASAWLECEPFDEVSAGDHTLAMLQIHRLRTEPAIAPLVFHASRFRRLETGRVERDASAHGQQSFDRPAPQNGIVETLDPTRC